MVDYFVVKRAGGPSWDRGTPRRAQPGWDAHAAFMDQLVADGFVVLGGPLGDLDGDEALLVVAADSEEEVRRRLAADPWTEDVLRVVSVRPWTIWLRHDPPPA